MRPLIAALLSLLLLSAAPRAAHACGSGSYGGGNNPGLVVLGLSMLAVGAAAAGGDIAFTAKDLFGDKLSLGGGIGESLLAAPQVALGAAWLTANYQETGSRVAAGLYTAWMSALLVHGIYSIATAHDAGPLPHGFVQPDDAEASLKAPAVGLGMTYVDVGQRSAPGLGVVGRF